ncbi:hypothetical protein [uncultured Draconibacterium sp.]|uniref:hypothetical protein n=1 Tax=uncultured Draconibacterium sp. TaxID=1573823 RepID=UPI0025D50DA5|nr:hypothetical protein [uncultured Draconibacterium sp.]
MSLREIRKIEVENSEHEFKYQLGDVVYLKTDSEFKLPLIISDFVAEELSCCDYEVSWMSKDHKREISAFPEECLIQKNE